jgi:hypothetical protein
MVVTKRMWVMRCYVGVPTHTSFFNIQNLCTFLTKCIYVLHIILKVNYFPTQYYMARFVMETVHFLWGIISIFMHWHRLRTAILRQESHIVQGCC